MMRLSNGIKSQLNRIDGGAAKFRSSLSDWEGAERDLNTAFKWYKRSADRDYAPAQTAIGLAYETGMGVKKDESQAVKFYRLAAEKEDSSAQYYLGKALYDGTE